LRIATVDASRPLNIDMNTAAALLAALGLAAGQGGAVAALTVAGIVLPNGERLGGLSAELERLFGRPISDEPLAEALVLGFLAGRVAHRPRARTLHDPTAFLSDRHLIVRQAAGEPILRLPWFEDGLFVGRQLPDISELPTLLRRLCTEHYWAALAGERRRFELVGCGQACSVDAVPAHEDDGNVQWVLAIAGAARSSVSATTAYERMAARLDRFAAIAEERAERHRTAGRSGSQAAERRRARKAREAAERARANAWRLDPRAGAAGSIGAPSITPREAEVLSLASHGLTIAEIAEQLDLSSATVKTHLGKVYPKLGASDKASAVAAALRHGLID
jgi:DNA-binding NarL/FixJ family response regulator